MSIEVTCRKCGEEFDSRHTRCPGCGDDGTDRGPTSLKHHTTETLEGELKELSTRIAADPLRFQQVREELARRHAAGNDQPAPDTEEQRIEKRREAELDLNKNLVLKITAMEAEQAKLVVEAEIFKSQRDEAMARLALLARTSTVVPKAALDELCATITEGNILNEDPAGGRDGASPFWLERLHRAAIAVVGTQGVEKPMTTSHLEDMREMLEKHAGSAPAAREPLSRDDAKILALEHKHKLGTAVGTVDDWVVDAVVEASK